jgi:hypothetical protein
MNPINVERLPKKILRDPQALGNICVNLAFRLSGEKWNQARVRNVEFGREIIDRIIGEEPSNRRIVEAVAQQTSNDTETDSLEKEPLKAEPTFHTTRVNFYGVKETRLDIHDKPLDFVRYQLSTSVRQSVQASEIPERILDEIFEDYGESEDEHSQLNAREEDSVMEYATRENLDDIEIERELFVQYGIDQDGEIDTYRIDHTYYFNDEDVHGASYDTEQSREMRAERFVPLTDDDDDRAEELRPVVLGLINEAAINREARELEEEWKWESFLTRTDATDAMEIGSMTPEEHRERALGMLSLLMQDIFPIKEFARPRENVKQL